jgi:hypothetical protein
MPPSGVLQLRVLFFPNVHDRLECLWDLGDCDSHAAHTYLDHRYVKATDKLVKIVQSQLEATNQPIIAVAIVNGRLEIKNVSEPQP